MSTTGQTTTRKTFNLVDYIRHPVAAKWNKKVVDGTANGVAKFKPGLPLTPLGFAALHEAAYPIGAPRNADDVYRLWARFSFVVGASNGQETKYILIKRDCCYVHARPITKAELRNFKVTTFNRPELS
jgi:hypothetical protein